MGEAGGGARCGAAGAGSGGVGGPGGEEVGGFCGGELLQQADEGDAWDLGGGVGGAGREGEGAGGNVGGLE